MRVSKWVMQILVAFAVTLAQVGVAALVLSVVGADIGWALLAPVAGFFWLFSRVYPRTLSQNILERVQAREMVHFTTDAALKHMLEEGRILPGGQAGWVHIAPAKSKIDAVGLGGKAAAYFFSGFPSRHQWVMNVGRKATVAIVVDPALAGEMKHRPHDDAVMLIGGYHGPAKILRVPSDYRGRASNLSPISA